MNKNIFIYVFIAIIIGIFLGNTIYNGYKNESQNVFSEVKEENIFLIQYGVYSSNELMIENTKELKSYFYYEEDGKYHVLIGITRDKELKDKIVLAYNITTDVYLKPKKIKNDEFIQSLSQYDSLVKETDNDSTIINAEKQILSKFEELVLRSE